MKKFDCVTIGGATRDIIFKTDDYCVELENKKQCYMCFEYGRKIIPSETYFSFGGGALNSAVSMARLGLSVSMIVNIGNHEAKSSMRHRVKDEGIDSSLLMDSDKKTDYRGISVILVDKGKDHTAILHRGTNDKLHISNWSFLNRTKWIYVTSLTGKSDMILGQLEKRLSKSNVKLAWNPGSVQLKKGYSGLRKLLKKTSVLILNEQEAHSLVCSKEDKVHCDLVSNIEEIKSWGPEVVVITKGAKGAEVSFDGKNTKIKAAKTKKVLDTTGAGDAFGSTFIASLILGVDPDTSLKMASVNSASVVSFYGAQDGLLKKSVITKRLRDL